jgi:hypothetical protein
VLRLLLAPGEHEVFVTRDDAAQPATARVSLAPGETVPLSLVLDLR